MISSHAGLEPWRFGVLFSRSGVTAGVETTQLNATILAIEAINAGGGILGRPVEPVIYDPASDPKQFRAALGDLKYVAPQGRVRIDPSNNHSFLWLRVAKLDAHGRFRIVWDPGVRTRPSPYCVDQRLDSWSWPERPGPAVLPLAAQG